MKYKVADKVSTHIDTLRTVSKNVAEFVDATCLAVVSGFAIYQARYNRNLKSLWASVLLFAGLVIALQAFVLLVRHFNKKG